MAYKFLDIKEEMEHKQFMDMKNDMNSDIKDIDININ